MNQEHSLLSKMSRSLLTLTVIACMLLGTPLSHGKDAPLVAPQSSGARLILIVVMDGLRPDSINREDTPTLFRLRQEGVSYLNSHSVFPTVTRVNAAAISTGTYPDVNGLVSNSMFVPRVQANRAFNTSDHRQLFKLREVSGGRLLFAPSLAERLAERGIRFAAVSSGSTGSALLLNHRAPDGIGVLVNGNFDPGRRVAYPDASNAVILSRFGAAPSEESGTAVDWADRVLREYILPDLKPEVAIDWQTEPDGAQHRYGAGSPEARQALANSDRNLGLTLAKLRELGLADKTDVIVLSDHGFSLHNFKVDAARALIDAGLKTAGDSDDVVLASNGQSVLVHVKHRDPQRIKRIISFLQAQDWVDVIFTAGRQRVIETARASGRASKLDSSESRRSATGNELGWVPGTFSLGLIRQANAERGADILFTLPWTSAANAFGVPGKHYTDGSGNNGPLTGNASGHGGLSPWLVRNTMILWGPDFKRGATIRTAACNVDIAPTVLALKGVSRAGRLDGRVLWEALNSGPDEEQIPSETKVLMTGRAGGYRAAVQVTDVISITSNSQRVNARHSISTASGSERTGAYRYIDKAWRMR